MLTVERWTGEDAAWDAAVAADADGTFCHLAGWREVMAGSLGHEPLAWVARAADGRVAGLLPAVAVRSLLFGRYLVSMPFLNAGGPLGAPEARILLAETAVAEARARAVRLLELRTRGASPPGLVVSRRKITHVLPLPPDAEALWRGFPPKLRSQVRRPQKEGLEARTGPAEREAFYEVFARHMRALGTPVLPATWFDAIARHLAPQVVFVAVYRGAEPVAGGCGFCWRDTCEITWASALRAASRAAPNMLLYWTMMQEAIRRGASVFDFGRCTPGSATHAFKRQWGGEDVPLTWGQWRVGAADAPPSPERPVYRAAAACWRHLPLGVTNRVGPLLARGLP